MGDLREELIRLAERWMRKVDLFRKHHAEDDSFIWLLACLAEVEDVLASHPAPSPSAGSAPARCTGEGSTAADFMSARSSMAVQGRCGICNQTVPLMRDGCTIAPHPYQPVARVTFETPSPSVSRDAPWYLADGSTVMLPAKEVERRRKLAAKVLAQARAFRADFEAHGREGVALSNIRPIFDALDDLDAAAPSPRSEAESDCVCGHPYLAHVGVHHGCIGIDCGPGCVDECQGAGCHCTRYRPRAPVPAESATKGEEDGR